MKADAFLDQVHGQYTRVLERKLNVGLLSHSPKNATAKKAYGCFVYTPIRTGSVLLFAAVRPIEMVASAAIHLVGAAFAEDKKGELRKAVRLFTVRLPLSVLEAVFRMVLTPIGMIGDPISILKNPIDYETKRMADYDLEMGIARMTELMKDAQKDETKKRIEALIAQLEKGIPVSYLESMKIEWQVSKEKPKKPQAEMPRAGNRPQGGSAALIISLAEKYHINVSEVTKKVATGRHADSETKKQALKQVIRQLHLTLHPDKTMRMPENERQKREEDLKILNNAIDKL